jgi:hypothetical protein
MAKLTMRKIFLPFFLLCLYNIHALDIEMTDKNVEARAVAGYNRSYYFYGAIAAIGAAELNNRLVFKSGLSFGWAEDITEVKIFSGTKYRLLESRPLELSLAWIYNGLPEYEAHSHTVLPMVSYNARRAGIAIGPGFRFTSFLGESAIFEPTLSVYGYINIINNESLCIGVGLGNVNDFQAGNFMALFLNLYTTVKINDQWSIINELDIKQSGGDGLAANFYGIVWRGGARFSW